LYRSRSRSSFGSISCVAKKTACSAAEGESIVDAAVTRSRPSVCRRTSSELCPNEEEV